MRKIVLMGAAGEDGLALIGDLFSMPMHLRDSEVWLQDDDIQALETVAHYAGRINQSLGDLFDIRRTPDADAALAGADVVVMCEEAERFDAWERDWQIPLRHGVRHVRGELAGPGGISHALRAVPGAVALARRVEARAPGALLIVLRGPVSQVCMAIAAHTGVNLVGMPAGTRDVHSVVARTLDLVKPSGDAQRDARNARRRVDASYAGLDGFAFVTRLDAISASGARRAHVDIYPQFRERFLSQRPDALLLSRRLLDAFGLLCAVDDDVAGDNLSFGSEAALLSGPDFGAHRRALAALWAQAASVAAGELRPAYQVVRQSGLRVMPLIAGRVQALAWREMGVLLRNGDIVPGLPPWAIVATPASFNGSGIAASPAATDQLPQPLIELMRRQVEIQRLTVEAALDGDRRKALQALLLDPLVRSHAQATHLLDALLDAHREALPRFFRADAQHL